ncbi:PAS domain S-box protein [Ruegeria sp. SCPT10]|uniref:PAS domain S-box protein n=1 Tax=Ruegeria sp. SCP10 TaxID=3141377 RepID=UPI00333B53E6
MDELTVSFLESVAVPIVLINDSAAVAHANSEACKLFGYFLDELSGISLSSLFPMVCIEDIRKWGTSFSANGKCNAVEAQDKSGALFPLSLIAQPWCTESGEQCHTLTIQEQQKISTHQAVNETLQRVDLALRQARIGVFEINLLTGKSIVSPSWYTLMGYPKDTEIDAQAAWEARIHPEDLKIVQKADQACIEGKTKRSLTDFRMRTLDGSGWTWMRSDAVATLRDETGRALRLIGTQTDNTEIKERESEIELSEMRFRSALDNAPIGMALVGLDGTWLRVNDAVCKFLGYSKEDLLQTDFQTLTHADDLKADLEQADQLLAGDRSAYQMEKRYIRSDGTVLWGNLNVVLIRDQYDEPSYFIKQIVDITEQRALAQLKSEFISTVSHELRTPLTSVLGSLDLIAATSPEDLPDNIQRLINMARTSGARLHVLIDDILDLERLSEKEISIECSKQKISDLVIHSVDTVQAYANQFEVTLKLAHVERDLYGYVDTKRLQQVIVNLLSNAAKFSHPGGKVDVFLTRQKRMAEISVVDQGIGIPAEFVDSVFEPFRQAEQSDTRLRGGTGLGLSIAKKIVERLGGTIGFENNEKAGATFWFRLPLATPPESARN